MTENPFSTQGWNRYSYVGNSPVNFTDPSGYCFMGCFWQPVFRAIGNFFRQNWRAILQIAVTGLCHLATGPNPGCAALGSFAAGITSGNLGQALRGAAIAFVTAAAFTAVGDITHHNPAFGTATHMANIAGHALVGCVSAVAQGARCGPGALSGAVGSFASPLLRGLDFTSGLVAHAVVGGLASVAAGGNFANGAVTAAFGYLFNEASRDDIHRRLQDAASRAVREFDAMGDHGFSPGQLAEIEREPWRRAMYRGYNIDRMVRDIVAADPQLQHLRGNINRGVDFVDPKTGIRYEMTTPGQFRAHQLRYGEDIRFIDTSRAAGGLRGGGGGGGGFGGGPGRRFPWHSLDPLQQLW